MDEFTRPKTYVEWMLGNSCNYNCSYCLDLLKRGDFPTIKEEIFLETCKDIIHHYDDLGRDVIFEFIGGEPTLMNKIPEVGQRLHNYPTNIILRTNGSASLKWWLKARRFLSTVIISVHREFADIEHIQNVIKLLKDENDYHPIKLKILFPVTIRPESWNWGITWVRKFRKRYNLGDLQLLYSNFGRGSDKLLPYSKEQWEQYNSLQFEEEDFNNYSEKRLNLKFDANGKIKYPSFKNYTCYAGLDTLVIDAIGNVYRGWCMEENLLCNIYNGPLKLPTKTIKCTKDICSNGFDLIAKKTQL